MKRLLLATDAWHPQVNGVVRVLDRLRRETPAFGLEIEILSPEGFATMPLPSYPEIRLALCRPGRIARRIAAVGADYIHVATEGPIGLAVRHWCIRNGHPFTTSFHTRFPEYLAARLPVPVSLGYAWIRRFHNAGRGVMVSTERLGAELRERGFHRTLLWPRAVDTELFTPGVPAVLDLPRPIFLYVGRVAVEKGIGDFLGLDLPGSKVVIGDGPQRAELEARFPDARFLGPKFGEDLVRHYRAADVFVFPSRTDTLGLVMLEALACGLPVAAYPVIGALDIVGGHGVGALDQDLRRAAMAALGMSHATCRIRALDFSWAASAEHFVRCVIDANAPPLPAAA